MANAARRGFVREGSLLLGLGAALWLAGRLYRQLGTALLHADDGGPWPVVVYCGLALVLVLVAAALSALATPLVRRGPLRLLDRAAGLAVGLVEASLAVGLLASIGQRFGLPRPPAGGLAARALDLSAVGLTWLTATIPPEILKLASR